MAPFLSSNAYRLTFLAACAAMAAAAVSLASPSQPASLDPGLATLLRGMAIIKTAILVGVCLAIWWRLGSPIRPRLAAAYIACGAAGVAGAALVWAMAGLHVAPFLFEGGLLGFLILVFLDNDGAWARALTRLKSRRSG